MTCRPVALLLSLSLTAAAAQATVFGDGDPANGVEDGRRILSEGAATPLAHEWFEQAGTIFCDGAVRGSAVVLDLAERVSPAPGVFLATAAHVLYDLASGKPWQRCSYHHLGLGALPGYQADLQWKHIRSGEFDPSADPANPANGSGDWAFIWLGPDWSLPRGGPGFKPAEFPVGVMQSGRLGLVAWDASRGEMSVMVGCGARKSESTDLGGGAWEGQWLDDCDSGQGASGGGLISLESPGDQLVGLRGGSHWIPGEESHPAGGRWDVNRSTNYARALDASLLRRLDQLVRESSSIPASRSATSSH